MANFASLRGPVGMNRVYVEDRRRRSTTARSSTALGAAGRFATNGPLVGWLGGGRGAEEPGDELRSPRGRALGRAWDALGRAGRSGGGGRATARSSPTCRSRASAPARTRPSPACGRVRLVRAARAGRTARASPCSTSIRSRARARSTFAWGTAGALAAGRRVLRGLDGPRSRRPPAPTADGTRPRRRRRWPWPRRLEERGRARSERTSRFRPDPQ